MIPIGPLLSLVDTWSTWGGREKAPNEPKLEGHLQAPVPFLANEPIIGSVAL